MPSDSLLRERNSASQTTQPTPQNSLHNVQDGCAESAIVLGCLLQTTATAVDLFPESQAISFAVKAFAWLFNITGVSCFVCSPSNESPALLSSYTTSELIQFPWQTMTTATPDQQNAATEAIAMTTVAIIP